MLIITILCFLSFISFILHIVSSKAESKSESGSSASFHRLQHQFFTVYFFATFSDWLQGPYVYKLYSYYGYTDKEIAVLYVIGFGSSVAFGTAIGSLADKFGRRRLCILYSILYSLCCLTKVSSQYNILLFGRILGGISTSILFSTFESWYVHQHTERFNYPPQWMNITFAKATFYNGILSILAGILSNLTSEWLHLGPVSPFLLAIPCLIVSGLLTVYTWEENSIVSSGSNISIFEPLTVIFSWKSVTLVMLGVIQTLLETVMYIFVFLWTPILEPMNPPLGIVFSCFMVSIMIGSSLYSFLLSHNYRPENMLTAAMVLSCFALTTCTIATAPSNPRPYTETCFTAFLLFEIALGIYYPAIGYLRSRVIPEEFRAGVTSWFRVPMNILTCISLLLLRKHHKKSSVSVVDTFEDTSHVTFLLCSILLVLGAILSLQFAKRFSRSELRSKIGTTEDSLLPEVKI